MARYDSVMDTIENTNTPLPFTGLAELIAMQAGFAVLGCAAGLARGALTARDLAHAWVLLVETYGIAQGIGVLFGAFWLLSAFDLLPKFRQGDPPASLVESAPSASSVIPDVLAPPMLYEFVNDEFRVNIEYFCHRVCATGDATQDTWDKTPLPAGGEIMTKTLLTKYTGMLKRVGALAGHREGASGQLADWARGHGWEKVVQKIRQTYGSQMLPESPKLKRKN